MRLSPQQFAASLRRIADLYEQTPDLPVPDNPRIIVPALDTRDEAVRLARLFGGRKEWTDSTFVVVRDFGGVDLAFVFWRSSVCTRRVVGQRVIPAQPATPERTEDVMVWDCPPLLSEGS